MEGFKTEESRLVRLFQEGREKWRKRAAEKQKKMRAMEIKIRDLSLSRDQWKAKALTAQEEQEQLKQELEELKKKLNSPTQEN
jgi:threonine aldolase